MAEPEVSPDGEEKPKTLMRLLGGAKASELESRKFTPRQSPELPAFSPKPSDRSPRPASTQGARAGLQGLVRDLINSGTQLPASGPKVISQPMTLRSKVMVITGLAMVAAALATVVIDQFRAPPPVQVQVDEPITKETIAVHVESLAFESRFAPDPVVEVVTSAQEVQADYDRRRELMLKSLESDGMRPAFIPAADIRLKPGVKQTLYCLLRAPLDTNTEEEWDASGMFALENDVISPFLRTITIGTTAQLTLMNDYRVESVAENLFPRVEVAGRQRNAEPLAEPAVAPPLEQVD